MEIDNLKVLVNNLSDNAVINLANDINGLLSQTDLIDNSQELTLPQLVAIGTQSSGKSSVLNRIMGFDILPTDSNMCTRTPLDILLNQTNCDDYGPALASL